MGVPKGAARQGVVNALRSKPFAARAARGSEDPTPDRPGIRIYAPPVYRSHDDRARWWNQHGDTATAAYACACGQTGTAAGATNVAALAADYADHKDACTGATATVCERGTAA
ncbi:hypothetical protein [Streptomyces tauricus]